MGGINFGWLAVRNPGPDWLCLKQEIFAFVRRSGEAAEPVAWESMPCPDFASNTVAFALQLREISRKNLIQVNRMAFGCSVPKAICLFDFVIAGVDLDWLAVSCRVWLSRRAMKSNRVQFKYLSICRNRWVQISTNVE